MHRRHRLRSSADFSKVMRSGARTSGPGFILVHLAPGASNVPRVGFSTSRALGTAVVRNAARRRLREALRPLLDVMIGCDVVVVARPDVLDVGVPELGRALEQALSDAGVLREPAPSVWTSDGTMGVQNPSPDLTEGTSS